MSYNILQRGFLTIAPPGKSSKSFSNLTYEVDTIIIPILMVYLRFNSSGRVYVNHFTSDFNLQLQNY